MVEMRTMKNTKWCKQVSEYEDDEAGDSKIN